MLCMLSSLDWSWTSMLPYARTKVSMFSGVVEYTLSKKTYRNPHVSCVWGFKEQEDLQ